MQKCKITKKEWNSMLSAPDKIETAYHEAGHAVIAHRSKYVRLKPTSSVSILEIGDAHGGVDVETDPKAPKTTDHRIAYEISLVGAAGRATQLRYLQENNAPINEDALNAGASADLSVVRENFGSNVYYELTCVVDYRLQSDELWNQVKLLAEALMQNETLTFGEVEEIIGKR